MVYITRTSLLTWGILLVTAGSVYAQATISGRVSADGAPVAYANVGVRGTTLGNAANADGIFHIPHVPAGSHVLAASAVGFTTVEKTITVADGETASVDFELEETVIKNEGVVVTGTLKETFIKESPVKVDVVSGRYFEKVPTSNLMDVIENVNGLYQQIDCGVCYTNNIRINGMDGPYTAVLIDGMPIMSSLATVYGLNGISPAIIQQIEVIKGPVSTLYGTEAMGGVINIITKKPTFAPRLSVNTFATDDREFSADVAVVPTRGRFATLLSGTLFYNDHFFDDNGDLFADITMGTRLSLFGKGTLQNRDGFKTLDVSAKYYHEDRHNGVEDFTPALRGSGRVYGESIYTNRVEVMGSYALLPRRHLKLDVAYNRHDQDSYYGDQGYNARQQVAFAQLVWSTPLGAHHDLLLGATLRHQTYDDNTGSTGRFDEDGRLLENLPDNRLIPGFFVQNEYVASDRLRLLGGLRLDHHDQHGLIVSPRASLKWNPAPATTLRLNGGTGFRVVNLFTEDHAAYSGARATVLLEALQPERSYSATVSLQQVFALGANPLTIDIDGFYTYFTNKIEPDYGTPGQIRYANLDGSATTRGVSLSLSQRFTALPLSYTLGITAMDVFTDQHGRKEALEFAPEVQGVATASYHIHRVELTLDYTATLTGSMRLPSYDAAVRASYRAATGSILRTTSPTFAVHNIQMTKELALPGGARVDVYAGVRNIFDYVQPSPLVGFYDGTPGFGETFDTAYVYGPIRGRNLALGVRLNVR